VRLRLEDPAWNAPQCQHDKTDEVTLPTPR
jgi:hypothetical protein